MEKKTLYRYFGNCATEEERIQVLEWTKASPENLKEFCRERNIYNAILLSTDNIQRTKYDFRRHYRAQLLRIAAVVILLLSVAFGSFYLTMGDRIVPLYSLTVPAGNSNTRVERRQTREIFQSGSRIIYFTVSAPCARRLLKIRETNHSLQKIIRFSWPHPVPACLV